MPPTAVRGLSFEPLTPELWDDCEDLFGAKGACAGCWCMYWRRPRKEHEAGKGAGNKRAFKRLVTKGDEPGILAYVNDEPVAWCAVAPREEYGGLGRSRILKPVDDKPVWSITCLFVRRGWRRKGISAKLLDAAAKFARDGGARIVEGYPTETKGAKASDAFIWTGTASAFERAGFREVARRSPTRPIMRRSFRAR